MARVPAWALGVSRTYDPDLVVRYQFDGKEGCYRCGQDQSQNLFLQVIDYRRDRSVRWGRPLQTWLDVAFFDAVGAVSVISFNKQSVVEVSKLFGAMTRQGLKLQALSLKLGVSAPVAVTVDDGDGEYTDSYYVVDPLLEHPLLEQELTFVSREQFDWAVEIQSHGFHWESALLGEVDRG